MLIVSQINTSISVCFLVNPAINFVLRVLPTHKMIAGSVTLDINSVITSVVGVTVVLRVEPNKNAAFNLW